MFKRRNIRRSLFKKVLLLKTIKFRRFKRLLFSFLKKRNYSLFDVYVKLSVLKSFNFKKFLNIKGVSQSVLFDSWRRVFMYLRIPSFVFSKTDRFLKRLFSYFYAKKLYNNSLFILNFYKKTLTRTFFSRPITKSMFDLKNKLRRKIKHIPLYGGGILTRDLLYYLEKDIPFLLNKKLQAYSIVRASRSFFSFNLKIANYINFSSLNSSWFLSRFPQLSRFKSSDLLKSFVNIKDFRHINYYNLFRFFRRRGKVLRKEFFKIHRFKRKSKSKRKQSYRRNSRRFEYKYKRFPIKVLKPLRYVYQTLLREAKTYSFEIQSLFSRYKSFYIYKYMKVRSYFKPGNLSRRVFFKNNVIKRLSYNFVTYVDRLAISKILRKKAFVASINSKLSFFNYIELNRNRFKTLYDLRLNKLHSLFGFYFLYSSNAIGKRIIRNGFLPFVDFVFLSNFVVSFLLDGGSLFYLTALRYNKYVTFRLYKMLSHVLLKYQLVFTSSPKSNKYHVFSLPAIDVSNNLFFKYQLFKYREVVVFNANANYKLIIRLSAQNKIQLCFKYDNLDINNYLDIYKVYYYQYIKKMFSIEFNSIVNNNVLRFAEKIEQFGNLKSLFVDSLASYKENFINFYNSLFSKFYNKHKLDVDNSSIINELSYKPIVVKNYRSNYFFHYCLFNFSMHYFLVSNFHLGVERNRWDPNFVYYYIGLRRNFLILNMQHTLNSMQALAYNIYDFVKYRLPIVFVNQNRLIDMFLYKTLHSLCLEHRVLFSGYRWLGGSLSNVKNVLYLLPGANQSYYKNAVNSASTNYLRSSISLVPVGVSLNNIKNTWFINELRVLNLQSHSIADGNGVLISSENLIAGNTLSLASNVFFLNLCRLIVESAINLECSLFTVDFMEDIILDDEGRSLGNLLSRNYNRKAITKHLVKKRSRLERRSKRAFRRYNFYKWRYLASIGPRKMGGQKLSVNQMSLKLKTGVLEDNSYVFKYLRQVSRVFKLNRFFYKKLRNKSYATVFHTNYMVGRGTFFRHLSAARLSEQKRYNMLIERGYSAYLPKNSTEKRILNDVFSYNFDFSNKFLLDYIEYVLLFYVKSISRYRRKYFL